MVSITEGSQERRHSTKREDEEKSAIQEENCNTFKVGHRLVEMIKSLVSSGMTRLTKGEGRLGLGASDSRQGGAMRVLHRSRV